MAIGSDPEFFLRDRFTGEPISCAGLLGGANKNNPVLLRELEDKHEADTAKGVRLRQRRRSPFRDMDIRIQEDNVMLEVNTTPVQGGRELYNQINDIRNRVCVLLSSITKKDVELHRSSKVLFDSKTLDTPKAKEFGCDPDMNIYLGGMNQQVTPEVLGNHRVAGGHLHFSFDKERVNEMDAVATMDCLIGLGLVLAEKVSGEMEFFRSSLYGKAGNYRQKEYGVEYRTPSNFWALLHDTSVYQNFGAVNNILNHAPKVMESLLGDNGLPVMDIKDIIDRPAEYSVAEIKDIYDKVHLLVAQENLGEQFGIISSDMAVQVGRFFREPYDVPPPGGMGMIWEDDPVAEVEVRG